LRKVVKIHEVFQLHHNIYLEDFKNLKQQLQIFLLI